MQQSTTRASSLAPHADLPEELRLILLARTAHVQAHGVSLERAKIPAESVAAGLRACRAMALADDAPQGIYGYMLQGAEIAAVQAQDAAVAEALLKQSLARVWSITKPTAYLPNLAALRRVWDARPQLNDALLPLLESIPGWCLYVALPNGKVRFEDILEDRAEAPGRFGFVRGFYICLDGLSDAYIAAAAQVDETAHATALTRKRVVHILADVCAGHARDVMRSTVLYTLPVAATWEAQLVQITNAADPAATNPLLTARFVQRLLAIAVYALRKGINHATRPTLRPESPLVEQRTVRGKRSLAKQPRSTPVALMILEAPGA
jgi:hypothetical protein